MTWRFYLIPSEWLGSITQVTAHAGEDVEKGEHSSIAGGAQTYTATMEISVEGP